eukprot:m.153394 g.153394  ORF g.153394 m.153394 type:complete len:404 (+) comp14287_c3_seq2:335-1546(+)
MGKPANNNDVPTEAVSGATLLLLLLRMMWLAVAVEVVAIALGSWTLAAAIPIAMYLTLKFIQVPNTLEFVSNPTPLEFLLHGLLTPLYKRYKSGHALPVISSATHLQADPKAFEKYCELTGFKSVSLNAPGVAGSLFMQALNISMCGAIVAHPNFPFGALGLIHIRNTIRQTEEFSLAEPFYSNACVTAYRETDKGYEMDFVVDASKAKGEPVFWRCTSTLLYKCKTSLSKSSKQKKTPPPPVDTSVITDLFQASWTLAGNMGILYGNCSGDYNPIHLHPMPAQMFGHKRNIAHGMFTLSKSMAELNNKSPLSFPICIGNEWKLPLYLPAKSCQFEAHAVIDDDVKKASDGSEQSAPRNVGTTPSGYDADDALVTNAFSFCVSYDNGKPHLKGAVWSQPLSFA